VAKVLKYEIIKDERFSLRLCPPEVIGNLVAIHYGNDRYIPRRLKTIKNKNWVKPEGGLWTSPVGAKYGWKEWCESEQFRDCDEEKSFKLKFKSDTKIAIINSYSDLENMPIQINDGFRNDLIFSNKYIDYEFLVKFGIDAIWLTEDGQWKTRLSNPFNLYGWDCDTIFIMNRNCCYEQVVRKVLFEKFKKQIKNFIEG
jgi:hypothetical protein